MRLYAVVSKWSQRTVELFPIREEADAVVEAWDEPDQAGVLHVELIELEAGAPN